MPAYFIYARKSTDVEDKQVLSIEGQLDELRSLAKSEGLEVAAEFVEKRSAKIPGRLVFNEMLQRIQTGEAQGIICWKINFEKHTDRAKQKRHSNLNVSFVGSH